MIKVQFFASLARNISESDSGASGPSGPHENMNPCPCTIYIYRELISLVYTRNGRGSFLMDFGLGPVVGA